MTGAAIASAATGVASLGASKRAGDRAADVAGEAIDVAEDLNKYLKELGAQGVDFAQGLLDDWEGTFGGIQDNLADYYQNLDPTKYATQAKSNYSQQMDKQMKQFEESMAATGLQSAGMKQQAAQEAAFAQAQGNAAIDLGAEDKVHSMQQGFLNFGEGQRNTATNAMNSALARQGQYATAGGNALMGAYNGQANQYGQSASGFAGAGGNLLGTALGLGINADWGGGNNSGSGGNFTPAPGWTKQEANRYNTLANKASGLPSLGV